MAVSGSYDFENDLTDILTRAYSLLGVVDPEETLSDKDFSDGRRDLNNLLKFLSIHRSMWLQEDVTITLTPGTASYTMGVGETVDTPKPLEIIDARRYSSSIDIPIDHNMTRDDYLRIPNKTLQAPPTGIYYLPGRTTGTLYVWPTGTSTDKTLKLTTHRPIQDMDIAANNPDLPAEWILCIEYTLAVIMAPRKLGGVVPPDLAAMQQTLFNALSNFSAASGSMYII